MITPLSQDASLVSNPEIGLTKISRLFISKKMNIFLLDYGYKELEMQPLVKTVFLLFLNHPEGISFYDLQNYKAEVLDIYHKIVTNPMTETSQASMQKLLNRQDNSMNEKISRINQLIRKHLPESVARQYTIQGERRMPKKISLNPSLIIWEEDARS